MGISRSQALALCATVGLAASGCSQIGMLKGKMAFQDANKFYSGPGLSGRGREVRGNDQRMPRIGARLHRPPPDAGLLLPGQQLRPAVPGGQEGRRRKRRAADQGHRELQEGVGRLKPTPKIKRLALDYLVSSYGPDKLNDPAQAEPILLSMIEMDPKETSSYFGLANIYEQSGDYERAEQMLTKARDMRPERFGRLHAAGRLLQPPGRLHEDDGGAARAHQARAHQSRGALHGGDLLLGKGLSRLHHAGARQDEVRPAGPRRPSTRPSS